MHGAIWSCVGLYQRSFLFWDSEDYKMNDDNQATPETEAPDTQQTDPAAQDQQNTETEQQEQSFTQSQLDSEADKRVAKALAKAKADYQAQLDKGYVRAPSSRARSTLR